MLRNDGVANREVITKHHISCRAAWPPTWNARIQRGNQDRSHDRRLGAKPRPAIRDGEEEFADGGVLEPEPMDAHSLHVRFNVSCHNQNRVNCCSCASIRFSTSCTARPYLNP